MAPQRLYLGLLHYLLTVYILQINAQTSDDVRELFTKIFTTDAYNKNVRPTYDQNLATNVTIDFILTGIIEFEEQQEKLTTSGYLIIEWYDYYLTWDPSGYNDLSSIFIPQDKVWKPDLALKNGFSEFKEFGSGFLYVHVESTGFVSWQPYEILQSTCNVDITFFPFDIQTCTIQFVAWSFSKDEVLVKEGTNGIILDEYEGNSAWTIVSSSTETFQGSEEVGVIFALKLRRKPLFYLLNIIVPVILLSTLNACVFVLPAESGEKASFAVTLFLSMGVFLTIATSTLPQNSDTVSYLGIYLVMMALFSTLIVVTTLFQLRLNFRDVNVDPVPSWLIRLQMIVKAIRCQRCNKINPAADDQNRVLPSDSGYNNTKENKTDETATTRVLQHGINQPETTWKNVCNALDFSFFWIFFLAIFITTVTIFSISASYITYM